MKSRRRIRWVIISFVTVMVAVISAFALYLNNQEKFAVESRLRIERALNQIETDEEAREIRSKLVEEIGEFDEVVELTEYAHPLPGYAYVLGVVKKEGVPYSFQYFNKKGSIQFWGAGPEETVNPIPDNPNREPTAEELWTEWPGFSLDLQLARTGNPLKENLPLDFIGDPSDQFISLEGVTMDGQEIGVLITDIGSGLTIQLITLYTKSEDGWTIRYQLKEVFSTPDSPVQSARASDYDLILEVVKRETEDSSEWEKRVPLPGKLAIENQDH